MSKYIHEQLPRRLLTREKYRAIQRRWRELYHSERLRLDDVETRLVAEFFVSRERLMAILRVELPADESA